MGQGGETGVDLRMTLSVAGNTMSSEATTALRCLESHSQDTAAQLTPTSAADLRLDGQPTQPEDFCSCTHNQGDL